MPRKKPPVIIQRSLDGTTTETPWKPGDADFVAQIGRTFAQRLEEIASDLESLTNEQIVDMMFAALKNRVQPGEARTLRTTNRGPDTGKSRLVAMRIKGDAFESIQQRADELDMSMSEYLRSLVYTDTGVVA